MRNLKIVFVLSLMLGALVCAAGTVSLPLDMYVIFSDQVTPQTVLYVVREGDTVAKIAQKYHTTEELIRSSNHLNGDHIRDGQALRVWRAPFTIIVDKKQNILSLKCGREVVKTYRVATGAGNNTPVGRFTVRSRLENPVWYKKGVPIEADDPENALGTRWLGLDQTQYGIHGTIHPESIGNHVSHGCVRMLNEDVEELYDVVPLGTKVIIVDG